MSSATATPSSQASATPSNQLADSTTSPSSAQPVEDYKLPLGLGLGLGIPLGLIALAVCVWVLRFRRKLGGRTNRRPLAPQPPPAACEGPSPPDRSELQACHDSLEDGPAE